MSVFRHEWVAADSIIVFFAVVIYVNVSKVRDILF
jgi:hypothetical protein